MEQKKMTKKIKQKKIKKIVRVNKKRERENVYDKGEWIYLFLDLVLAKLNAFKRNDNKEGSEI
jgi:hypothetical protein